MFGLQREGESIYDAAGQRGGGGGVLISFLPKSNSLSMNELMQQNVGKKAAKL